ncbi:MAG TPA: hypothetical protein VGQ59_04765 [Cyclobacteriaceae bacterium]|jgi:hypothetical protein|nr:hypothetical protein [Cyclobacteriaceae bacterium]
MALLLTIGCRTKQNSQEASKSPIQFDSLSSESYKKLFSPSFNWEDVEIKVSDDEKRSLIKVNTPWVLEENVDSNYLSSVHIMDFNNDSHKDFIYSGPGAAYVMTQMFISGGTDTTRYSDTSIITNIDIKENKVQRIYIYTMISSGGPSIGGYSMIDIKYDGVTPSFVRRLDCESVFRLNLPTTYTSFNVESISDTVEARYEPIELDTPQNYILEMPGNQLGKITKGTKATVVGEKDSLGIKWYFTLIRPDFKIKNYPYYGHAFDSIHTYRVVWAKENGWKKVQ